jgi:predicted Fe-S protein YdhL (DUF1289 family)
MWEGLRLRVLRICGRKRDEVTGEWRILNDEERNDLYYTPSVVWVSKLRRMRLERHVACMGEQRGISRFLVRKRGKETTWKTQS